MKIKLSRQQWETIGKTAGWAKLAQGYPFVNRSETPDPSRSPSSIEIQRAITFLEQLKEQTEELQDLSPRLKLDSWKDEPVAEEIAKTKNNITMIMEQTKNALIDIEGTLAQLFKQ